MMVFKVAMAIYFASISVMATADGEECMTEDCKEQGSNMLQVNQQRRSEMNALSPSTSVNITTIAGVPVTIHESQYQGGTTSWFVDFVDSCTDKDLDAFGSHATDYGATVEWEGHPEEGGLEEDVIDANFAQLQQILEHHSGCNIASVEQDVKTSAIPEIDSVNNGMSLLVTNSGAKQVDPPSWGLDRIDDRDGPLDRSYDDGDAGAGVHVYVLDTGIDVEHSDFGGRAIPTLDVTVKVDGRAKECGDGETSCAKDVQGHGTHCAGTIGGASYGVAKQVTLHSVKVLGDDGSGSFQGFNEAIDWVATKGKGQRPGIISASLGGRGKLQSVKKSIDKVTQRGVVVVVAAGNEQSDACHFTPASVRSAVTVGSTSKVDHQSSFSNYGECLDIFAPGEQITSAAPGQGNPTDTMSGTSMACPHVAGVAAIVQGRHQTMSASDVINMITGNATPDKVPVKSTTDKSPTLLLYSGFMRAPTPALPPTPAPPPSAWLVISGACVADGACVKSPNYPHEYGNEESCRITTTAGGVSVSAAGFNTELDYDKLFVHGTEYHGTTGPLNVVATEITWSSDISAVAEGWRLCAEPAPQPAPAPAPTPDGTPYASFASSVMSD